MDWREYERLHEQGYRMQANLMWSNYLNAPRKRKPRLIERIRRRR